MGKENLLAFFKEKNELVNQNKAFTSLDLECLNSFDFIVSNKKDKDGCSIEIKSINNLFDAVKEYYSKTSRNYKQAILYSKDFDKEKNMFVTPVLSMFKY